MTNLFSNSVILRGFLAEDAKVPASDQVTDKSYATLTLVTVSGIWDLGANVWQSRTDWHRVICPGPFFCGLARGLKHGDYVEVEGELHDFVKHYTVVIAGKASQTSNSFYSVHAIKITRLDRPDALVDYGEDG